MITTEGLLTSPGGFGIATASPAQRAACRILDGLPLGELAENPEVVEFVGGPEALAELPSERGEQPSEVVFLAAIRSAKTIMAVARAIVMTQTVDVSRLGPGEVPRVSIVSLKLDVSSVPIQLATATIKASPALRGLLLGETADTLTIRHPSGRSIELASVAGARAGGGLVARWSAGVIFDEAPRMTGADDAVVNLSHARTAVLGRLLPGAQALYIGSPWAPYGPVYDLVQEFWRRPTEHMVVLRGTGPMLNPVWWTPDRCARLEKQNATAHQTDVLGEFADPESGLLNPVAIRRNTREFPFELSPERGARYVAGADLSGGGARGNASTLVILRRVRREVQADEGGAELRWFFAVALAREWRGTRPDDCLREMADVCDSYGLGLVHCDAYAGPQNVDLARRYRLFLETEQLSQQAKVDAYTDLATVVHTDRLEFSPHPILTRDVLSIRRRLTQSGVAIHLPVTSDGRHADFAPALVLAIKHANAAVGYDGAMWRTDNRQPLRRMSTCEQGGFGITSPAAEARYRRSLQNAHILNVPPELRGLPPSRRHGF